MFTVPTLIDIPPEFHSIEFDGPFQKCTICTTSLLDAETIYSIEKVYRGAETILEMAVCLNCAMASSQELSEESLAVIQTEFEEKGNWQERMSWISECEEGETPDPNRWLERCVLTGEERSKLNGYQIGSSFQGDQMMLFRMPYLISASGVASMAEKLSKKSQDYMRDFVETNFGMPPELCDPPVPILM